ncbi:TetR/AcrR family transcriptional regulator [Paenibacillus sp. 1P07SE]|uniref:TetR/AcrR family transcriptional regulator n=1 Tax=Paenibacillus sp. 1P07SE TaxID=3132209 RepID=UPI0039A7328A
MAQDIDRNVYLKLLRLLSMKGTHFTTEDLARELGTSKRTLYAYFSGKHDMIDKTIDFIFADMERSDAAILDNESYSFKEKFELYFSNVPDSYHIGVLLRYADDFQRHYPEQWAKAERHIHAMWDDLIALVEQGIENGALRKVDTTILRLMLDQTLVKLLDYEYTARQQVSFESGMRAMCEIVLYGLVDQD